MIYIGIDPGLSGAVAARYCASDYVVFDMPIFDGDRREIDPRRLRHMIARLLAGREAYVMLERAGARPGEGVSSSWRNGATWGATYATVLSLDLPVTVVSPAVWKRRLEISSDKEMVRKRAGELLPAAADQWPLKKHHGRAEAALLAHYASLVSPKISA